MVDGVSRHLPLDTSLVEAIECALLAKPSASGMLLDCQESSYDHDCLFRSRLPYVLHSLFYFDFDIPLPSIGLPAGPKCRVAVLD